MRLFTLHGEGIFTAINRDSGSHRSRRNREVRLSHLLLSRTRRPMSHHSAVEYILKRVSTWAGLSDTAAFIRQNEIRAGIDECHRELTTCSDKFTVRHSYVTPRVCSHFPLQMALSMMNTIESHRHNQARERDHRQLVDMIAHFLEEVQRYSRFMATEASQLGEPLLQVSLT